MKNRVARISLIKGDITKIKADAIVNAANNGLLGGGGVDGAIHKAGGPELMEACRIIRGNQGGCATGEAVITGAGNLQANHVIHTVGPIWSGGSAGEVELLADCYRNSIILAVMNHVKVLAFPNISTGVYGFPKKLAAETAVKAVKEALVENKGLKEVVFVCYDEENFALYDVLLRDDLN